MPKSPRILIPCEIEPASWTVWTNRSAYLISSPYVAAIQRAGGVAVLLPPDENPDAIEIAFDTADGILLAGGADIDPQFYGAELDPHTVGIRPQRDRFEIALVKAAVKRDVPLLGICRGCQLINVAFGGTLIQHLPNLDDHRSTVGSFVGNDHEVKLKPGSLVCRIAGGETHSSKSHHHQGIATVGAGLKVTGYTAFDDLVEAIELDGASFFLGIQWHPEEDAESGYIAALVEAARSRTNPSR